MKECRKKRGGKNIQVIEIIVALGSIFGYVYMVKKVKKCPQKKEYQKAKMYVEIVFVFSFLALVYGIMQQQKSDRLNFGTIAKTKAGEGTQEKGVHVYVEGLDKSADVSITIPEKVLSKKEVEQAFTSAKKEVEKQFLKENKSFDEITSSVHFPKQVLDHLVDCNWNIESNDILDPNGNLIKDKIPKEGKILNAQVTLICQKEECIYSFSFFVKPVVYSKMDIVTNKIKDNLNKQDNESPYIQLPNKINGYELQWSYKKSHTEILLLFLGFFSCGLLHFREYEEALRKEKARRNELNSSYAELVGKICLFLEAGMTTRTIWEKISLSYLKQKQEKETFEVAVYEEMLLTYNQMQEGIPELEAYQQFATRCKEAKYKKLVSLITQNIQKGQQEFIIMLENEVKEAFTERKMHAKKIGEEASTKLLLPMMIMLFIVIAILIIPAVFTFQI